MVLPSNAAIPAPAEGSGSAAPTEDTAKPESTDAPTSSADPCGGEERPRGADEDGGGGMGRGFVLS